MFKGFQEFIMRGNVIQLAVGVIIGSAFTAIVTALTNKVMYPLIAVFGSPEAPGLGFELRQGDESTFVDISAVITAVLNFLLIAAVVYFLIVLPMNKVTEAQKRRKGVDADSTDPTETQLLTEIRDLLAASQKSSGSDAPKAENPAENS